MYDNMLFGQIRIHIYVRTSVFVYSRNLLRQTTGVQDTHTISYCYQIFSSGFDYYNIIYTTTVNQMRLVNHAIHLKSVCSTVCMYVSFAQKE